MSRMFVPHQPDFVSARGAVLISNPGTGSLQGATEDQAVQNMSAFLADLWWWLYAVAIAYEALTGVDLDSGYVRRRLAALRGESMPHYT